MYSRAVILCAAAALLAVSIVPAADEKPAGDKPADKPKGPLKEGADLPGPFRPFNVVNGKYVNKFHCITNEHGLNPTVIVFAQNADTTQPESPLPKLLQELDKYIVERPKTRLNAFAVFLFNGLDDVVKNDEARNTHADELTKLKSVEPALQQVVLCLDSAESLKSAGYGNAILPEKPVVVVLYDKLKVTNLYSYKDAKDIDVAAIMKEVKEKFAPFKQ
jgi:hypothetical protein